MLYLDCMKTAHIVCLFYVLLFFGLFLGDGKQSVVEVYGAAITIVLWLYFMFSKQAVRALPHSLALPWVGVGAVAVVSTALSDSVGYSISWLVRLSCGYLLYRLFYSISSKQIIGFFQKGALLLTATAGVLWVCVLLFPWFKNFLPSMNLIDVRYGHSHLADLLVFISPIVWSIVSSKQRLLPKALLGFVYLSALLATQSRGAWLLVGLFVGMQMFLKSKKMFLLFLVSLLTVFGIGGSFLKNYKSIEKVIVRPTASARLEYWRQAVESIKERPLLGSGPGTFSLTSLRLQSGPNRASWFVHSQPLQIASEMGLIGFGIFVWLVIAHVFFWKKESIINNQNILLWMMALIFIYGAFEFVLDYFVIWLLFWAGAGFLSGINQKESSPSKFTPFDTSILLGFISIFYILWVISVFVTTITGRNDTAYYLAPFDTTNALLRLTVQPSQVNDIDAGLSLWFHRNNSTILMAIAKSIVQENPDQSVRFFENAVFRDPQNAESYGEYVSLLSKRDDKKYIASALSITMKEKINFFDSTTILLLKHSLFEDVGKPKTMNEYKAKLYYLLGHLLLQSAPEKTREMWTLARDLAPGWGYFHVELASLYFYIFNDSNQADNILKDCTKYESARVQCEEIESPLEKPGRLYKQIQAIPQVI